MKTIYIPEDTLAKALTECEGCRGKRRFRKRDLRRIGAQVIETSWNEKCPLCYATGRTPVDVMLDMEQPQDDETLYSVSSVGVAVFHADLDAIPTVSTYDLPVHVGQALPVREEWFAQACYYGEPEEPVLLSGYAHAYGEQVAESMQTFRSGPPSESMSNIQPASSMPDALADQCRRLATVRALGVVQVDGAWKTKATVTVEERGA